MHRVLISALFAAALCSAATAPPPEEMTIVIDFQGPHSARAIDAMKQEFYGIMKDSGIRFHWALRNEAVQRSYENLVVVRFNGKCILEPVGYLYDERGPLAFTHTTGESILPFSEVACDNVTAMVRSAMFGGDYAQADLLLGRALGRVVAHEMVHILTQSHAHAREGVYRTALSGKQLISPTLQLSSDEMNELQVREDH